MAKRKTKTPEQLEAERLIRRASDLEAVSIQPEAAVLPSQQDIEVIRKGGKRDQQKVEHDTARRLDAFSALKDGMAQGATPASEPISASPPSSAFRPTQCHFGLMGADMLRQAIAICSMKGKAA